MSEFIKLTTVKTSEPAMTERFAPIYVETPDYILESLGEYSVAVRS